MKCLNCGKETDNGREYCSMFCRKTYARKECDKILKKVENYFQLVFNGRFSSQTIAKRVYCYICCVIKNLPKLAAGNIAGLNHTTIEYHIRIINEEEIALAKEIAESEYQPNEHYKPKEPIENISMYEKTGFRYDNGKKECSTKWKRIQLYPVHKTNY